MNISEASIYCAKHLQLVGDPEWETLIMSRNGKERVPTNFALAVIEAGGRERLVIETIKAHGMAAARKLMRESAVEIEDIEPA